LEVRHDFDCQFSETGKRAFAASVEKCSLLRGFARFCAVFCAANSASTLVLQRTYLQTR
jgi:hypothetical protein